MPNESDEKKPRVHGKAWEATAKYWGKILASVATLACAWLATKTDEILEGRDKRDEDIVRLMAAVDRQAELITQLRIENATTKQTLEWLRRTRNQPTASTSSGDQPIPVAAAPLAPTHVPDPLKVEEVPIDEETLRAYQKSRSR